MSGPAALAIWTGAVLDASLKTTVVLGLGLAVTRALKRSSAANRHAVWTLTFAALPALLWASHRRGPQVAIDAPWLAALWLTGACVAAAPLAVSTWRLRRIRWTQTGSVGRTRLGVSAHISGPITWGWLRPVVLLSPRVIEAAPHREAALAHELAHVQRGDWLIHTLTWLTCAAFWFHPLVWPAWRQLAMEAEHAADDAAIASGVAPSSLAALLLGLASHRPPRGALGIVSSPTATRIRSILEPRTRHASRWRASVVSSAGLALALTALGQWQPWTAPPENVTCQPAHPRPLP